MHFWAMSFLHWVLHLYYYLSMKVTVTSLNSKLFSHAGKWWAAPETDEWKVQYEQTPRHPSLCWYLPPPWLPLSSRGGGWVAQREGLQQTVSDRRPDKPRFVYKQAGSTRAFCHYMDERSGSTGVSSEIHYVLCPSGQCHVWVCWQAPSCSLSTKKSWKLWFQRRVPECTVSSLCKNHC